MENRNHDAYYIVGLGNYDPDYFHTRHNIGFEVIDAVAERFLFRDSSLHRNYYYKNGFIDDTQILLCMPTTYMNRSGDAVRILVEKYSIPLSSMLIVCDDTALPLGQLRLRIKGSSGGHNGLQSIIGELGTNEFPRLRCGVSEPSGRENLAEYVLSTFSDDELVIKNEMVQRAADAVITFVKDGAEKAMTVFNTSINISNDSEMKDE